MLRASSIARRVVRPLSGVRGLATGGGSGKESVASLAKRVSLKDKVVLVRADLNVPMTKEDSPKITDDTRIRGAVPTIKLLQEAGAKIVLCSHLGRPKKTPKEEWNRLALAPVAAELSSQLGTPVEYVTESVGPTIAPKVPAAGHVLLLENLRFDPREEKNDPEFASALATSCGASVYVNDAFGAAHRAHGSTAGVASAPGIEHSVAGLLMEKELKFLSGAVLDSPKRPLVAIVGGAKVSTKLPVLESLLGAADAILIGGAMAFTFVKARGGAIGNSLCEDDMLDMAKDLVKKAEAANVKLLLPSDAVVAAAVDESAATTIVPVDNVPDGQLGLDIGPAAIAEYEAVIAGAGTVVWNGPMGVFEMKPFAAGTLAVANGLAEATKKGTISVVGGGDSVAAVNKNKLGPAMSHVSTGGGASLELLEGKVRTRDPSGRLCVVSRLSACALMWCLLSPHARAGAARRRCPRRRLGRLSLLWHAMIIRRLS